MKHWKPGDRVCLYSQDQPDAKISTMQRVETDQARGWLLSFIIDDYGETQDYFFPDNGVTDAEAELRRNQSGMPLEFAYKRLTDFNWNLYQQDTRLQEQIASAFIDKFNAFDQQGRGLYIFSDTRGSGKTFLSCCVANEVLNKKDISVKFVNVVDYVETVKKKDDRSQDTIQRYMDCSLLIFDDIGVEDHKQAWIQESIFRLIDRRYTEHLPTIFTSNYPMESLPGDERISSRIIGVSIPVAIPDQPIRAQLAERDTADFLQSIL